jgi:hypothetical protein
VTIEPGQRRYLFIWRDAIKGWDSRVPKARQPRPSGLPHQVKHAALTLSTYMNNTFGEAQVSLVTLAYDMSRNWKTVKKYLDTLEAGEWLLIRPRRGPRNATIYTARFPSGWWEAEYLQSEVEELAESRTSSPGVEVSENGIPPIPSPKPPIPAPNSSSPGVEPNSHRELHENSPKSLLSANPVASDVARLTTAIGKPKPKTVAKRKRNRAEEDARLREWVREHGTDKDKEALAEGRFG